MSKNRKLTLDEIKYELAEVGRVGQIFIEGDLCYELLQPYAVNFMKGDDMDYNPEAGVPLKKTLLRVEKFARVKCSTTIWRRRTDLPDRGEAILLGRVIGSPDAGDKPANRGYNPPKLSKELQAVFLRKRSVWKQNPKSSNIRQQLQRGVFVQTDEVTEPTTLQYYVPVYDSMGEVAAALEVHTTLVP